MATVHHSNNGTTATKTRTVAKHVARPAAFKDVLKTYGLSQKSFKDLQAYLKRRLPREHAAAK